MKKLLSLLLVLGMTSLAGAAHVKLTEEGNIIHALPGQVVMLTIEVAPAGLIALDVIATVTGGDLITGATDLAGCAAYGWDPGLSFDPLPLPPASTIELGLGNFMGNMNTIVAYIEVTYSGLNGDQTVSIAPGFAYGGSGQPTMMPPTFGTGFVKIVPEPVTIVLLGFGGIVLLRRRK